MPDFLLPSLGGGKHDARLQQLAFRDFHTC